MNNKNHYTPYRDHMYLMNSICKRVVPTSVEADILSEDFAKMPLKARRSAYYIQAFSRALKQHPRVNSSFVRGGIFERGPKVHHFEEASVALSIDKKVGDDRFPMTYVIRNSDQLSVQEIDERLDFAIKADTEDVPEFQQFAKFMKLPSFVRKQLMVQTVKSPERMAQRMGTFNMTNVSKWGLKRAVSFCPRLLIAIGDIRESSVPVTYSFNHVLMDGAQVGEFHEDVVKIFKSLDFK